MPLILSETLQKIFEQLCEFKELNRLEAAEKLLSLAKLFATDNVVPSLEGLEGISLQRGAYILDLFSSLFTLDSAKMKPLRETLLKKRQELIKETTFSHVSFYPNDSPGFDEIATYWGLTSGMRPARIRGFLDLQRRGNQWKMKNARPD